MINLTLNQKALLAASLEGTVFRHKVKDGVIVFSRDDGSAVDETELQTVIDAYDPLIKVRAEAKARIVQQANEAMQSLEDAYPEFEKKLFPYQKADVDAWKLDNNAVTPTIDSIASHRGKDRNTHLAATVAKVDAYHAMATAYAGERQRLEDIIDNETDWQVIQNINFDASVI